MAETLGGEPTLWRERSRPGGGEVLLAAALSVSIVLWQSFSAEWPTPVSDARIYIRIALPLLDTGVFTSGGFAGAPGEPGMFFTPLYPGVLASLMHVDGAFESYLRCVHAHRTECDASALASLVALQSLVAAGCALLVFLSAWRLTRSPATAWLAWLICILSGVFAKYSALVLTETFSFLFFLWFNYLAIRLATLERPMRAADLVLLGAALGAAALCRPSFLYLGYGASLILLLAPLFARRSDHALTALARGGRRAVWFAIGTAALVLPWMIRNAILLDTFKLSDGYAGFILVQRVSYNMMSWKEWGVSFIYWLPDFGDNLAKALFDEADYRRLSWHDPSSYYQLGNGAFREQTLQEAGERDYLGYLLGEYVLKDLIKHLAVAISIAIRGVWVGGITSALGLLLAPAAIWILARRGRALDMAVIAAPGVFMLGLHAFVSVNVVRYNEPLILLYATAIAVVAVAAARRVRARRPAAS